MKDTKWIFDLSDNALVVLYFSLSYLTDDKERTDNMDKKYRRVIYRLKNAMKRELEKRGLCMEWW